MADTTYPGYIKPRTRLMEMARLELTDIRLIIVLTIGVGLLNLATPVAVQALINIVTMGGLLKPLLVISIMLFLFLLLSGSLYVLEKYVVELIQRRAFIRMANDAAHKMQSAHIELHDKNNSVELMNRFFEVANIQKSAASLLTVGLETVLQGGIGSLILIFYSSYFAIIVALIALVMFFIVYVIGHNAVPTAIEESKAKYETAAWLETIARNRNTFKLAGGQALALQRIDELSSSYLAKRVKHFRLLLWQNIGGVFLYAFVGTAMLALGGGLVLRGQINLGQFVAAELIIFGVLTSFLRFIRQLENYYDLAAGVDKFGLVEDFKQESYGSHTLAIDNPIKLSAKNITFEYSKRLRPVENISFEIAPKQSLSVLGPSGSGKSTLADILTGLRPPTQGQVAYDNIDIRHLNLSDVRKKVSLVSRLEIIEGTIAENLRLGHKDIDIAAITDVLSRLDLLDELSSLDEGLETQLTFTGAPLSASQSRLIILARAILTKPALLVVDGLLDGLEDDLVRRSLDVLFDQRQGWTLVIMTRFPHIAERCDQVITLNA